MEPVGILNGCKKKVRIPRATETATRTTSIFSRTDACGYDLSHLAAACSRFAIRSRSVFWPAFNAIAFRISPTARETLSIACGLSRSRCSLTILRTRLQRLVASRTVRDKSHCPIMVRFLTDTPNQSGWGHGPGLQSARRQSWPSPSPILLENLPNHGRLCCSWCCHRRRGSGWRGRRTRFFHPETKGPDRLPHTDGQ